MAVGAISQPVSMEANGTTVLVRGGSGRNGIREHCSEQRAFAIRVTADARCSVGHFMTGSQIVTIMTSVRSVC